MVGCLSSSLDFEGSIYLAIVSKVGKGLGGGGPCRGFLDRIEDDRSRLDQMYQI